MTSIDRTAPSLRRGRNPATDEQEPPRTRQRLSAPTHAEFEALPVRAPGPMAEPPPRQPLESLISGQGHSGFAARTAGAPGACQPVSSVELFQQWLAAGAAGTGNPGVTQSATDLLRGLELVPGLWSSLELPGQVAANGPNPMEATGPEDVQSLYRPSERTGPSVADAADEPSTSAQPPVPRAIAPQWHQRRMQDLVLVDCVFADFCEALDQSKPQSESRRNALLDFANHLSTTDVHDSLAVFLSRYESRNAETQAAAQRQLAAFLSTHPRRRGSDSMHNRLPLALNMLSAVPPEERQTSQAAIREPESAVPPRHLKWTLPPQDRRLLEGFRHDVTVAVKFGMALLKAGHAGLEDWLSMFHDGRDAQAREFLTRHLKDPEADTQGLRPVLERLQKEFGTPEASRMRISGKLQTFVVSSAAAPALVPADRLPPPSNVRRLSPGTAELLDVFRNKARSEGDGESVIVTRRMELRKFDLFLGDAAPGDGLKTFLSRYESPNPEVRADAAAKMAEFVGQLENPAHRADRRSAINIAVDTLISIPADQRTAAGRSAAARERLVQMSEADMGLLLRLRQHLEGTLHLSGNYAARLEALLTRFNTWLVQQGGSGLQAWLDRHEIDHATAKAQLEEYVALKGGDVYKYLPAATSHLQRMVSMESRDSVNSRTQESRRYPTGFPPAEAAAIDAAVTSTWTPLERLTDRLERDGQRIQLTHFSAWLREQREEQGQLAYPQGLIDMKGLHRRGEGTEIERLRDLFLSTPQHAPSSRAQTHARHLTNGLQKLLEAGEALPEVVPARAFDGSTSVGRAAMQSLAAPAGPQPLEQQRTSGISQDPTRHVYSGLSDLGVLAASELAAFGAGAEALPGSLRRPLPASVWNSTIRDADAFDLTADAELFPQSPQ